MTPYLLLADLESFFGIVVFLIALMGWIVNLVSQNQDPKNKRALQQRRPGEQRPTPRPRPSGVQNEIDQFLKQSRRDGGRVSRPTGTEEVEVISPPPSRRPPPPRRRRTRDEVLAEQAGLQKPPQSKPLPAKPTPTRKRSDLSQRSSTEPAKTRSKKSQQAATAQTQQKVSQTIDEHVKTHVPHLPHVTATSSPTVLGQIGGATKIRKRKSNKNSFAALLNSKAGVRNAVVLNEILSPPKALRNNRKD